MKDAQRRGAVRRQGPEPAQPRPQLLAEAGAERARRVPPDPRGHRPGHGPRGHRDRLGLRGAAARGEPDQALQAALQRPAQGRQELPVHQDHARRRLPARRAHPQAAQRRQPLLRAVRVGELGRRGDEPRPAAVPVPDLHRSTSRTGVRALPAAVPPVPHQALPGPVHRGRRRRPPTGATSARWSCSSRATPTRWSTGLRHEMGFAAEAQQYEKAAVVRDKIRAIERTMESQKMAAFARTELDLAALARKDDQAAVQLFVVRNGKMLGRDVFFLDAPARRRRRRGAGQLPRAVLRARDQRPARGPRPALARRHRGPRGVPHRAARVAASSIRTPQRGEKRELMELATRNAAEALAREAARWLADEGRTLRRARGAGRRARAASGRRCGSSATTSRTSRAATRSAAWWCSRRAGRGRGSTGGSRSGPSRGRTTSRATRRCCGAASGASTAGEEGHEEELRWAMPDLVIVDGGRGQVSAAKEVLDELGLHDLPLVGLAKEREELVLPDVAEPVLLPVTSQALYLVQRLRDEAHRFAITYHRSLRAKRSTRSAFDDLPGRRAEAPPRAAEGVRVGEAGARGAGRADRGGPGHQPRAGGADQGPPRGLTERRGLRRAVVARRSRRTRRRIGRHGPGPERHPARSSRWRWSGVDEGRVERLEARLARARGAARPARAAERRSGPPARAGARPRRRSPPPPPAAARRPPRPAAAWPPPARPAAQPSGVAARCSLPWRDRARHSGAAAATPAPPPSPGAVAARARGAVRRPGARLGRRARARRRRDLLPQPRVQPWLDQRAAARR